MGRLTVVKVADLLAGWEKCVNVSITLFIFEEIHAERKTRNPQREVAGFFFPLEFVEKYQE